MLLFSFPQIGRNGMQIIIESFGVPLDLSMFESRKLFDDQDDGD